MALIAAALLSADFARLGEALETIKAAGASMVHIDVTDGHFAPGISAGQPVIASLRHSTDLALDVRLAIERPERYAHEFIKAGADRMAVHPESTRQLGRLLQFIRARGAQAGVAVSTSTPLESAAEVLAAVDFVTVLSGHLGVDDIFVPRSIEKVLACSRIRQERRLDFAIQVEGGVTTPGQIEELIRAGADILVVGSVIFHSDNPKARLTEMIRLASEVRATSRA